MIVLTGGAGFVGSSILKRLNEMGEDDIVVVDNLKNSEKYRNLLGARFRDFVDKDSLLELLDGGQLGPVHAFLHQGACTNTLEYDGKYMMDNNYEYSKRLLHHALRLSVPFVYASSAAVYGLVVPAIEGSDSECPLNIYGYSKLLFDRYAVRMMANCSSTIVGLRYFNVYGPGESHKRNMSSMVLQLHDQVTTSGVARLFGAVGHYGPGEQTRDFVYVNDIVSLNMHFLKSNPVQAVVNAGSGSSRTWNDLASAVIASSGSGSIEYIPFPESLIGKYQFNTQADLTKLRSLGYSSSFYSLEDGVSEYIGLLKKQQESEGLVGARSC